MRKVILIFVCSLFTTAILAQADSASFTLPRTLVKISPLQFLVRTFELGIERFNPTYSRSFNVAAGVRTGSDDYEKGLGGGVELAYRKYVAPMKFRSRNSRDSYQGIYYGLFVKGEYFKGEGFHSSQSNDYVEKISSVTGGFNIGFQKTLWQILILDIYVGGGYRFSNVKESGYYGSSNEPEYFIFDPGYTGIYPKTGVKIGFSL